MKWFILFLAFVQTEEVLPCVFDKVDKLLGIEKRSPNPIHGESADECFAKCYKNNRCAGISYAKSTQLCMVYAAGTGTVDCPSDNCYILQRDDVDPVCQKYVYF